MVTQPDYCIYPSLLDKFQDMLDYEIVAEQSWNKQGDEYKLTPDEMYDKIEVELINYINRCPKEPSEAADKGTAFNEIVDCIIENRKSRMDNCDIRSVNNSFGEKVIRAKINGFAFYFSKSLCQHVAAYFANSLTQYLAEAAMRTRYGNVRLYGYIDEWVGNKMYDIKTTSIYQWGKFEHKWQRHLYPWCVIESGMTTDIESFTYYVIKWAYRSSNTPIDVPVTASDIYTEEYTYNHAESGALLQEHVEHFIEWLEYRKPYITDKRIFGGVNPDGYVGVPIDKLN